MLTGTISDFDNDGQFGVIDADDGRLVLFNLKNIEAPLRRPFKLGTRVEFIEQNGNLGPRALKLSPVPSQDGPSDSR